MGLELSWLGGHTGGHRPALSLSLSPAVAVPSATRPFGFSRGMAVGLGRFQCCVFCRTDLVVM